MFPLVSANDLTARERERERAKTTQGADKACTVQVDTSNSHCEDQKRKSILCSFNVKRLHLYV